MKEVSEETATMIAKVKANNPRQHQYQVTYSTITGSTTLSGELSSPGRLSNDCHGLQPGDSRVPRTIRTDQGVIFLLYS